MVSAEFKGHPPLFFQTVFHCPPTEASGTDIGSAAANVLITHCIRRFGCFEHRRDDVWEFNPLDKANCNRYPISKACSLNCRELFGMRSSLFIVFKWELYARRGDINTRNNRILSESSGLTWHQMCLLTDLSTSQGDSSLLGCMCVCVNIYFLDSDLNVA